MDEFDLIKTYFAPLAKGFPGSLNLADDAAIISPPPGAELVVTTDAINRGVHFIGDEDPALIARKLLRVNLSDLAAMGATPLCYFLALMLPKDTESHWIKRFSEGLHEDQALFGIYLAGGDTSATKEGMSFSATALGSVPQGRALKRSGARLGDAIYISGTLGDSALGLQLLQRNIHAPHDADREFLEERYLLPSPQLALGQKLVGIANTCMDVSDGLVQDLGHICAASGVGATINREKLLLSAPASKLIEANPALWDAALSGGDDYELLFTAPPEKELLVRDLSSELELSLTKIGEITEGEEVEVRDGQGRVVPVERKGFRHF